jgi:hypothetical protein
MTGVVVLATHQPSGERVLVRSYGRRSEVIIDRHQEIVVYPSFMFNGGRTLSCWQNLGCVHPYTRVSTTVSSTGTFQAACSK